MNDDGTRRLVIRARRRRRAALACTWTVLVLTAAIGAVAAWNWTAAVTLDEYEPLVVAMVVFNAALILVCWVGLAGFFIDLATSNLRGDLAYTGLLRYPGAGLAGYAAGLWLGIQWHPTVTETAPETLVRSTVFALAGVLMLLVSAAASRWHRRRRS